MFKRYFDYLRDNPKGYWFKNRLFGWGWVPVRWQGWLVILVLLGYAFWEAARLGDMPTRETLLWYIFKMILALAVLLVICLLKGEKPRWRFGFDRVKQEGKKD